ILSCARAAPEKSEMAAIDTAASRRVEIGISILSFGRSSAVCCCFQCGRHGRQGAAGRRIPPVAFSADVIIHPLGQKMQLQY
ncbi:hypothetical protein JS562_47090, partial [Agrobacterium sp. S2]|nr:hypothetical protein [Agrobacterium sp. S2]